MDSTSASSSQVSGRPRSVETSDTAIEELTRWELIGRTTRWGRYLAEIERDLIFRGEKEAAGIGAAIDMGCGGGRWSKLLSDRGWQMTCMDVNRADLAVCQRKIPAANCILTRPEDTVIPVTSGSAKIILCIEVIPLIESAWFVQEASRILESGGILVGMHINGQSLRGVASRLHNRLMTGQANYDFYQSTYAECRRNLLTAGFEMVHEASCCWGPFGRASNSPFVPAFVKLERALQLDRVVKWGPWVAFIARNTSSSGRHTVMG